MALPAARYSVGVRLFIIGVLTLVLAIPLFMIQALINEREARRNEAVREVSSKWGSAQTIAGPILSVPVRSQALDPKGATITVIQYAHFLPDDLAISGEIHPEIRYRGIYEVILYESRLRLTGAFLTSAISEVTIPEGELLWDRAYLAIGITDMKGIKDTIKIKWNGREAQADPGVLSQDVQSSGFSTRATVDTRIEKHDFAIDLTLNGSEQLDFIPVGKETQVNLSGTWGNPSFFGEFLPATRSVDANNFAAGWKVLHLNRNYPQHWTGPAHRIETSAFGVRFLQPVDDYQKVSRTAKYAIMFVALTFLSFFMIEVLNRRALHPIQYLLIGLALLLFYTLLLSISEQLGFQMSYVIASVAMTVLIAAYTRAVLASRRLAMAIAGILAGLYGYLYIILQLQDYALLMGSTGLFVILSLVMFLTRKIDWSQMWKPGSDKPVAAD